MCAILCLNGRVKNRPKKPLKKVVCQQNQNLLLYSIFESKLYAISLLNGLLLLFDPNMGNNL